VAPHGDDLEKFMGIAVGKIGSGRIPQFNLKAVDLFPHLRGDDFSHGPGVFPGSPKR
jgi:hypothetical protein